MVLSIRYLVIIISIHAPSRERQGELMNPPFVQQFQSTLPHGSDKDYSQLLTPTLCISIHAPSRERQRKRILELS